MRRCASCDVSSFNFGNKSFSALSVEGAMEKEVANGASVQTTFAQLAVCAGQAHSECMLCKQGMTTSYPVEFYVSFTRHFIAQGGGLDMRE